MPRGRGRQNQQNRGGGGGGGGNKVPWNKIPEAQILPVLERQHRLEEEDRAEQHRQQLRKERIEDEDREKEANKAGKAVEVRAKFQIVVGACDRLSAPRTVRKVKEQLARFSSLATPEEEASFFKVITGIKPTDDETANTKARIVSLAEAMEIMAGRTDNEAVQALIDHGYIVSQ